KRMPDRVNWRAGAARAGASCWQTEHQDPQKFSTITWPRRAPRRSFPPVSVGPDTTGNAGRCLDGKIVVPTAVDEPTGDECTSEHPAASTATAALAIAQKARTRKDTAENLQGVVDQLQRRAALG